MFPKLQRTPSQSRYADYAATELDELAEKSRTLRQQALKLIAEQESIRKQVSALTHSEELARCVGEFWVGNG